MASPDYWQMEYRPGGWARVCDGGFTVYCKLGRDPEWPARIRVEQLTLVPANGQPVTDGMLRSIPLAEIELRLVMLASVTIRGLQPDPGPELSAELVMAAAKVKGYDVAALERYFEETPPVPLGSVIPGGPRLSKPPEGRLTDDYLREVAAMYLREVGGKRSPAPAIASAAGVPVRTVHRWVAEARRRSILPPATKGRAG